MLNCVNNCTINGINTRKVVAVFDLVASKYTTMSGIPVGVFSTALRSPIVKSKQIAKAKSITELTMVAIMML